MTGLFTPAPYLPGMLPMVSWQYSTGDRYVPQSVIGERLSESLAWMPGDQTLLWYFDAMGWLFPMASIVVGQGDDGDQAYQPGYGQLFTVLPRFFGDTAICTTDQLPYVAQFAGVDLPPGVDDPTARSLITSEAGTNRGTPSAIVAAAQRNLTGAQHVINLERYRPDGVRDAYWFVLIVRPEEVIDANALTLAVNAVKPGGLKWGLVQTDGTPWLDLTQTWNHYTQTWQTL
jgi:hypothetical protein